MNQIRIVFSPPIPADIVAEIGEKVVYAWERIRGHEITPDGACITVTLEDGASAEEAEERVRGVVDSMRKRHHAVDRVVIYEHRVKPAHDGPVWDALVDRHEISSPLPGQVTLTGAAVDVLEALDRRLYEMTRRVFNARQEQYPTFLAKESLDRIAYFSSFPHHLTFAMPVREDVDAIQEIARNKVPVDAPEFVGALRRPPLVMMPAACLNTYVHLSDRPLPEPKVVTARVRTFRYESRNMQTLERLWEFSVREVVFLGPREWVEECRKKAVDATAQFVEELGLDAWVETANDPFFVNNFVAQRFFQLASQTKYELRLSLPYAGEGRSLAAASFNLHNDFFGRSFGIAHAPDFAFTGCVGYGLERWVWALFAQLGPDVAAWPGHVRRALRLDSHD
jgi:seryl-tRNA synthetase